MSENQEVDQQLANLRSSLATYLTLSHFLVNAEETESESMRKAVEAQLASCVRQADDLFRTIHEELLAKEVADA